MSGLIALLILPVATSCSMGGSSLDCSPCLTPLIEHFRNDMMLRVNVPVCHKKEKGIRITETGVWLGALESHLSM